MPLSSLHGYEKELKDNMTAAEWVLLWNILWLINPDHYTETELSSTCPFEDAFMQYIHTLPEKTKKREFITSCLHTNNPNTPEALFECIKEIETIHSQKTSVKLIRNILKPIVSELKSFYNIIDTLGSLFN